MQGVSKRYGGRARAAGRRACDRGRPHPCGARRERRRKVDPDQDHGGRRRARRRPHAARRAAGLVCIAGRGKRGRHRLHLPGAVADSRSFGGRQHRDQQSAAPLRADRPPGAAPHGRGGAGACRRREHPSVGAGQGLVAVAAADGRDRQGARPQAAHPDPRRGHLGADRRRRDEDLWRPEAAARGRARPRLHLAPDARDRRAGRRVHGVLQRPQRRELRRGHQDRQRGRRADDRPRVQRRVSAADRARGERCGAAARGAPPVLDRPVERHLASTARRRGDRPRRTRWPGPARAAAGAVRSAARHDGRGADRWPARHHQRSARREAQGDRHGADPGGPQDRGPDAADVGARQPLLRRARHAVALGHRRCGGRTRRGGADRAAARGAHRRHRPAGRVAFRGQSAEARHRQVADDGAAHPLAERSDARHRRRHQAGDVPAAARPGRRRGGDPLLLDRLRRARRLLRPRARDVRRRDQARTDRRRDHRTRAGQQRLEHRRRSREAPTHCGRLRRERRLALPAARAQGHAARLRGLRR